jgi:hypothetical protein
VRAGEAGCMSRINLLKHLEWPALASSMLLPLDPPSRYGVVCVDAPPLCPLTAESVDVRPCLPLPEFRTRRLLLHQIRGALS